VTVCAGVTARSSASDSAALLPSLEKAQELGDEAKEYELLGSDGYCTRIVDLEIVPHPLAKQPNAIEADHNMNRGVLKIKTRATFARYILPRWSMA